MAPTICTEKKTQIRVKKFRRHSQSSQIMSTSPSSIYNYVTTNKNRTHPRLRSSSTASSSQNSFIDGSIRILEKENFKVSPQDVVVTLAFDSDASYQSTCECGGGGITSSSVCCIDERLSPYSFYHDDDNFNSIDSDFHQSNISSSIKTNNSYDSKTRDLFSSISSDYQQQQQQCDIDSCCQELSSNFPFSVSQLSEIKNSSGLFEIAIKTIKLVKRNQILQHRLAQLQYETSEFIQSVLANPENREFRENIQQNSNTGSV